MPLSNQTAGVAVRVSSVRCWGSKFEQVATVSGFLSVGSSFDAEQLLDCFGGRG